VDVFGGRAGPSRGATYIEQVVAAAFQTFEGQEIHEDDFEKAAMLLRGITQGHPFEDGNKRTGFALATYYLELVGHPYPDPFPEDAVVAFCIQVSAGQIRDVRLMADTLRSFWSAPSPPPGDHE
jgi:death-on-curing protein